jgi:uncharacterized protein involved in outer membrane biogenesis
MVGSNFSSWYNQSAGTFGVNGDIFADASVSRTFIHVDDTTTSNRLMLNRNISSLATFTVTVSGANQCDITNGATIISNTTIKIASSYKVNDFALSSNGISPSTDLIGNLPVVSQLILGARPAGANNLNGHIQSIKYYPTRLPNGTLQGLTA